MKLKALVLACASVATLCGCSSSGSSAPSSEDIRTAITKSYGDTPANLMCVVNGDETQILRKARTVKLAAAGQQAKGEEWIVDCTGSNSLGMQHQEQWYVERDGKKELGVHPYTIMVRANVHAVATTGVADQVASDATKAAAQVPQPNYSTPDSDYEALDNDPRKAALQVALHYCALSSKPVPYEQLARLKTDDFAAIADTFKQHDMLDALKPQFDQAIAAARQHRYLKWHGKMTLQRYDFGQKSFQVADGLFPFLDNRSVVVPVALLGIPDSEGTKVRMGTQFVVADEALARQIETKRASMPYYAGSPFGVNVFAFIQQADGPHYAMLGHNELTVVITKMQLTDGDGGPVIAEMRGAP